MEHESGGGPDSRHRGSGSEETDCIHPRGVGGSRVKRTHIDSEISLRESHHNSLSALVDPLGYRIAHIIISRWVQEDDD